MIELMVGVRLRVLFIPEFLKSLLGVLKEKITTREFRDQFNAPRLCGTGMVGYMSGKKL